MESCYVLMVSSGAPTSHDLLILQDLLILSGGEIDWMLSGAVCMSSMQSMPTPIVAKNCDAHVLLRATWRLERMMKLMRWEAIRRRQWMNSSQTGKY
jgi:hypothetical protein